MVRKLANECLAVAVNAVLVNKKQENWLLFFIVIKIKEKKEGVSSRTMSPPIADPPQTIK